MCIGWMKQLVCGNQQCPEIIEELQQQVKVAAATPVFFYLSTNILRRSDACMASQGQRFQHFLYKSSSILSCSYLCSNKQCKIVVARTKHLSESKVDQ